MLPCEEQLHLRESKWRHLDTRGRQRRRLDLQPPNRSQPRTRQSHLFRLGISKYNNSCGGFLCQFFFREISQMYYCNNLCEDMNKFLVLLLMFTVINQSHGSFRIGYGISESWSENDTVDWKLKKHHDWGVGRGDQMFFQETIFIPTSIICVLATTHLRKMKRRRKCNRV